MIQSIVDGKTVTYDYDPSGQRIKYASDTATTYYPSKYFNKDNSGKVIKHIFAGELMLATIQTGGTVSSETTSSCTPPASGDWIISTSCTFTGNAVAPASVIVNAGKVLTLSPSSKLLIDLKHYKLLVKHTGGLLIKKTATLRQVKPEDITSSLSTAGTTISYHLTDHLGSTQVSTDATGTVTELSDYYPYGLIRLNTGTFKEQRKFIGQMYDNDTNLNYLNARYYDSKFGQFISQDAMFWRLPQELLIDPQQMNSYSYARNNPINLSDPSGKNIKQNFIKAMKFMFGAKTAIAPANININYKRENKTTLSVPLRDNNINPQTGKITGNVYSLVENQGIELNKTNHNVDDGRKATSLDGVQSKTILGAIDFKQQCNCSTTITGGTEKGKGADKIHGPDHWNGLKLDFSPNNSINNFIQNNFDSTGIRGDGAPGYQDSSKNGYWREFENLGNDHWDVKFNQSYEYSGYTIE